MNLKKSYINNYKFIKCIIIISLVIFSYKKFCDNKYMQGMNIDIRI